MVVAYRLIVVQLGVFKCPAKAREETIARDFSVEKFERTVALMKRSDFFGESAE
jgi:hypothetical protein